MKNSTSFVAKIRAIAFVLSFCTLPAFSQTDTLHLIYHHTQSKAHDTTLARIDKWIKTLNGKHMDVQVVAYFHKLDFKPFADERAEEMYLILNRKARELFTIEKTGSKKGKEYQRTMVDIIYKPTVSAEEAAAAAAKAKVEADAKKEAEKAAKTVEKGTKEPEKGNKESEKKSKTDVAKEQTVSSDKKSSDKTDKSAQKPKPKASGVSNGRPGSKPSGEGTYVKLKNIEKIKNARIILPNTDNPEMDSALTFAVKKFWTFSNNVEYGTMSYTEAKKLAKTDENILLFAVTYIKSSSLTHNRMNDSRGTTASDAIRYKSDNFKYVSHGASVILENGKGKSVLSGYFPSYKSDIGLEAIVFGVSQMNSLVSNLEKYNIEDNSTFNKPFKQNAPILGSKVLLLPAPWVSDKLEPNEILSLYEGKAKIVDYDAWSKAILEKQNYAYSIVVPYPIGGNYVYIHYLMDASTGDVLFIYRPKIPVNVSGFNVSASNTGLINSKNFKHYNDAFHFKENEEESSDKGEKEGDEKIKAEKKEKATEEKKAKDQEKEKEKKEKEEKKKK